MLKITNILYSSDNITRKYVQTTEDKYRIETTYVDYKDKHIICFSTQIGCNLGCKFCYNGINHNYKRNLNSSEICDQIENVINNEKPMNDKQILFSAMGIGEPLLNYSNLIEAIHVINRKYPNNKFALATTGIDINAILKLVDDLKDINSFKLQISLHATSDETRTKLMPACKNVDLLVKTVKEYKELSRRKVEWNYVLFNGINDSISDAEKLYDLLGSSEYIKLNKYNNVENSKLTESNNINEFILTLKKLGMQAEYYETNGADINGACGQMIAE